MGWGVRPWGRAGGRLVLDRFDRQAEPIGIEFPRVVQIETGGELTGTMGVRRIVAQPLSDVPSAAPGLERLEADEPHYGAVRVFDKPPAHVVQRYRGVKVQLRGELRYAQRHHVTWGRRERSLSHLAVQSPISGWIAVP